MNIFAMFAARLGLAAVPGAGLLAAIGSIVTAAVDFFRTPVGRAVGIILIGAALFIAGDVRRGRIDKERYDAKWAAAVAKAENARTARDEQIRRSMIAEADARIAAILRESEQLQSKVAEYEKALASSNAVACLATPDDARRLRELGLSPAGPGRGAGGVRSYPARGPAAGNQAR